MIVDSFHWAQWDCEQQILFYIHFRKSSPSSNQENDSVQAPILSALQFNTDIPHESVLNTPVNLPTLLFECPSFEYDEDDVLPLRVHDNSLNVIVLADKCGLLCICHHYIFQPVKAPIFENQDENLSTTVHLAYTLTILHQARVIHCTVPSLTWSFASKIKPTFMIYNSDLLLVSLGGMFLHMVDISPTHGSCCHVLLPPFLENNHPLTIRSSRGIFHANPVRLHLHQFSITADKLKQVFLEHKSDVNATLSILHYLIVHEDNLQMVSEILLVSAEDFLSSTLYKYFNELLVGGSYAWVTKNLQNEMSSMFQLLPITTVKFPPTFTMRFKDFEVSVSEESLWNPSLMLLSPQQRLCPFRVDLWSKLWDIISSNDKVQRFKPSTVTDKLMVSLLCYQPEALSRCTTPISPSIGIFSNFGFHDIRVGRLKSQLPFLEVEKCTASKQEHIISVNLRELNIHLVKYSSESGININLLATRYTAAQLEMSKFLCGFVTNCSGVNIHLSKGFQLIDCLNPMKRCLLFHILERVMVSADTLSYPLPSGFHSFISYLGYSTLPFDIFLQYVGANVLQLQIDVVKVIMEDLGNTCEAVNRKLQLLLLLPKSRAKRVLQHWIHPISLVLKAREHSANILSGIENNINSSKTIKLNSKGVSIFSAANRTSPLETFLNLMTAKADLAELDFNLLAEAARASLDF